MKTILYLVRHGETAWNILGKFQGSSNIDLSEKGILQAGYLNKRFQNKFDCIYASPLSRAIQTAEIICKGDSKKNPIIHEGLSEVNFGDWEGLTIDEIKNLYPSQFEAWKNDDTNGYLMGGDLSLKNASIRAKNAILDMVENNKGKKIIAVAHGGIIKAGLVGLFDWKMSMYHRISLENTSVTKIIFTQNGNIVFSTLNDTSHLPKEYRQAY